MNDNSKGGGIAEAMGIVVIMDRVMTRTTRVTLYITKGANIMEYVFMQPPFEIISFRDMTKKQAQRHFEWYSCEIPKRIEILRNAFEITGGGKKEDLNYTPESLIKIWNWYIIRAEVVDMTEKEIEVEKVQLPEYLSNNISYKKISVNWMAIVMDIAIYFSECFVKNYDKITWGYITSPRSLVYVNKPVLIGFKTGVELDATNIIRNLTSKVIKGEKNPVALLKLYEVWSGDI